MGSAIEHLTLTVNGIRLHVAVAGSGPLVILLHGFPELWSAWQHQLTALAGAGYRVAAPDLRGFGQSDAPDDARAYSVLHAAGDVIGLVHALDASTATVVGHDWGAPIAWTSALIRPDVIRAVAALNGPYRARTPRPPSELLRDSGQDRYYWFYMQTAAAVAELERDVPATLRKLLFGVSGDAPPPGEDFVLIAEGRGLLDAFPDTDQLPAWLDAGHFARLVAEYQRTGFRKPLYLYHNFDYNWELLAAWSGKRIDQPALMLYGDRDPTLINPWGKRALEALPTHVPNVRIQAIHGAGHWLQQERPAEVSRALLDFLQGHA
ncbi:MAG TPA: alpha/beta hydrolase [Polyangiales bacterium]|nr:alpha/beta hydrolase [Polyangiales bacterium]